MHYTALPIEAILLVRPFVYLSPSRMDVPSLEKLFFFAPITDVSIFGAKRNIAFLIRRHIITSVYRENVIAPLWDCLNTAINKILAWVFRNVYLKARGYC